MTTFKYVIYDNNGNWAGQTNDLKYAFDFIRKIGGEIYCADGLVARYSK